MDKAAFPFVFYRRIVGSECARQTIMGKLSSSSAIISSISSIRRKGYTNNNKKCTLTRRRLLGGMMGVILILLIVLVSKAMNIVTHLSPNNASSGSGGRGSSGNTESSSLLLERPSTRSNYNKNRTKLPLSSTRVGVGTTTKRSLDNSPYDHDESKQRSSVVVVKSSSSSRNDGQPAAENYDVELSEEAQDFLSKLEEIDNITPSLRVLLQAALSRSQDTDDDLVVDENDDNIDPILEEERCRRYQFTFNNSTTTRRRRRRRRRIFWGSLLADDSWHVLALQAMETYGLLHTVAFVESNTTQSLRNRTIRFPPNDIRTQLLKSSLLWGPSTQVSVDYYVKDADPFFLSRGLWRENDQRSMILERWKQNGMRPDDIGYLSDVDEVVSRDFLRALQICDNIPAFRDESPHHHDCSKNAKITATAVVFEGSPKCLQIPRRWNHPDFIIGECIDGIGNTTRHPPVPREQYGGANMRIKNLPPLPPSGIGGPLWDANDFRMEKRGSVRISGNSKSLGKNQLKTGYHFHNFFDSMDVMRRKYRTYGHPVTEAYTRSLTDIQRNDLGFMVDCLTGRRESGSKWTQPKPGHEWDGLDPTHGLPVGFVKAPNYATLRHQEFQQELARDEKLHPPTRKIGSVIPNK